MINFFSSHFPKIAILIIDPTKKIIFVLPSVVDKLILLRILANKIGGFKTFMIIPGP